ncbi:MAG: SDR family NAD(P)-dependent oxidoreductase [Prochlorococcus sp.]
MPASIGLPDGVIVITGARTGIGRGLMETFLQEGRQVIAVIRTGSELSVDIHADQLQTINADLSDAGALDGLISNLVSVLGARPIAAMINAAGIITPLGSVRNIEASAMVSRLILMAVAPTVLANGLVDQMAEGARILNISTRSALETFPGLSVYCMSKHALLSATRSLQLELPESIAVSSLIPGEVDTALQEDLRAPDPEIFPMVEFFRGNRPNLIPVQVVARFIHWVLSDTDRSSFVRDDAWYIYDSSHHSHWMPAGTPFTYPEP